MDGRHMYSRTTNLQREGQRTLNIPDEEEEIERVKPQEAEGENTEMSYEQYVAMFEDHIEKKAPNLREPASSSDDEVSSPRKRSRKPVTPKTPSKKDEEDAKS